MSRVRRIYPWSLPLLLLIACGSPESKPQAPASTSPPPPTFADGTLAESAKSVGIDFTFEDHDSPNKRMYETMGGGVTLFDADGDGDLDLFLPGGGRDAATPQATTHQALFRNDGHGRFTDVTVALGLGDKQGAFAVGGAAGDIDGDGDLDLYVACLGPDRLYRNENGRFVEIPGALGTSDALWSVAPAFFDADGDGDQDLYVANYVLYDPAEELPCTYGGVRTYCTPDLFESAPDRFYRNEGDSFRGFDIPSGKSLAAAAFDFEGDGDADLYVANDTTPNLLLINEGGELTDEGLFRGGALGRDGQEKAGMGVAVFDFDRDLDQDLLIPNFSRETYDLYRQDEGFLTEVADRHGVARATTEALGFGAVAADFDLDGWTDLALASGHINDLADDLLHGETFRQSNLLLRNVAGNFETWDDRIGDFAHPDIARGLAGGDLDGDGDTDLVLSRLREPFAVYLNSGTPPHTRWAAVRTNTSARILVLTSVGGTVVETVAATVAGGSYASQNEGILRFGLGEGELKEIHITDSDGTLRQIVNAPSGAVLVLPAVHEFASSEP